MSAESPTPGSPARTASIVRETRETRCDLTINLDGSGAAAVTTGIGFLDHMLTALACHSGIDIALAITGDLHVDDHHTAEDAAICLGQALAAALGDRTGIARFAHAYAPLDESLARVVIDLVQRPTAVVALSLTREKVGALACENIVHFFRTLAMDGRFTLHADVIRGENDHHKAEAAFKALALALRAAVRRGGDGARSTKGVL